MQTEHDNEAVAFKPSDQIRQRDDVEEAKMN
jgi:hypothetical protein